MIAWLIVEYIAGSGGKLSIEWRWRRATGGSILLHTSSRRRRRSFVVWRGMKTCIAKRECFLVDRRRLHRVKRLAKYPPRQTHSS